MYTHLPVPLLSTSGMTTCDLFNPAISPHHYQLKVNYLTYHNLARLQQREASLKSLRLFRILTSYSLSPAQILQK